MAIAVAVAVAIRVVGGHAFPDYDALFALIWGNGLAHGAGPDYAVPFKPAAHPLLTLITTAASPLGREGAADVVRWVALLGAGFFVAGVYRLGEALFGALAGGVAAVIVFTRAPTWGFALLSYTDALAAAFVLYAAVLEVARPRRGAAVFVLLAFAGLLRPELWLIAAAYWLWCVIGERSERGSSARGRGLVARALRLAPLAALGPVLWIVFDLVTSGSLFVAQVASAGAAPSPTSTGGRGLGETPEALVRFVGGYLRPPEVIAAVVGLGLAAWRRDRRVALPVALGVLNLVAFEAVATRNGPLEQRYLLLTCAAGAVLAAYAIAQIAATGRAAAGGRAAPRAPARPRWLAGLAGALALAALAGAPIDIGRLADLRSQVRAADQADRQLRALAEAVAPCLRTSTVQLSGPRLRPFIAYWAAIDESRVLTEPAPTSLTPLGPVARELVSKSLPSDPDLRAARKEWRFEGTCARQ